VSAVPPDNQMVVVVVVVLSDTFVIPLGTVQVLVEIVSELSQLVQSIA